MTGLVIAVLSALLMALVARLGLHLIDLYDRRYRAYTEAANEFYAAADRLVDNPNTPKDVLDMIEVLNDVINFPHTALFFVRQRQKRRGQRAPAGAFLDGVPNDVVVDFVTALQSWIDAVAFRSVFFGRIFKAYLPSSLGPTAAKVSRRAHHRRELQHA